MATQQQRILTWAHLSQQQLADLKAAPKAPGAPTPRDLLQQHECIAGQARDESRQTILLDLYSFTLQQAQAWRLTDEQIACLFSLVVEVHGSSVGQRLTIERSFELFKDSLLQHSVHRPPYSLGVFDQAQMQAIVDWMLATYYRHYKLYQYAFTGRVTLSFTSYHASDLVETAPAPPPLADAITEDEHLRQLSEQERKRQEEAAAAAAQAAAEAEAARQQAIEDAYVASIPEDLKEKVQAAVSRELALLRSSMEEQFSKQQAELLAKVASLEAAKDAREATAGATKK